MSDDLVVADLRFDNPNVYYELAVRHLVRKAVISFKLPNKPLPFDLKDMRVIDVNVHDVESTYSARNSLIQYIPNLPDPGNAEFPIGKALDWNTMDSRGAEERVISRVDQQLARILTCSELVAANKNQVIYSTANAMWEAAESILEQVVMELQHTEGDCARYCLERVRKIEEALLKFKREPYVDQNLFAS